MKNMIRVSQSHFLSCLLSMSSSSHLQETVSAPSQKIQSLFRVYIKTFLEKQNVCVLHQVYVSKSIFNAGSGHMEKMEAR